MDAPFERMFSIYLKPAELFFGQKPAIVTTVLGSCVSVTLFHQRLGLAAICHALLPQCREQTPCEDCRSQKYRYVNCVIPAMIQKIAEHCTDPAQIEVKLFGGSEMFTSNNTNLSVGRQNVEWAVQMIETQGLCLKSADVGGLSGRKIFFNTYTGQVFMKRLNNRADKRKNLNT